jgi:hypothetical protein
MEKEGEIEVIWGEKSCARGRKCNRVRERVYYRKKRGGGSGVSLACRHLDESLAIQCNAIHGHNLIP